MAQATPEQVQQLEKVHKEQLALLAQANNIFINGVKNAHTPAEIAAFKAYSEKIFPVAAKWHKRQSDLETIANIPKVDVIFFDPNRQAYINNLVKSMDSQSRVGRMGFIPILIWAIVAIAGLLSADYIVNQITDTVAEKQSLIESTGNLCTQLKLTPEQCQSLLTQSVASTGSDGIWGILKPLGLGLAGLYLFMNWGKISKSLKSK